MKKYHIHTGTVQEGPFDIEELKEKKILQTTPIWHEGLTEWTTAGKIEELRDLFKEVPPPFKTNVPPPINQKPKAETVQKKTTSWRSIFLKTAVTFFIIIGIIVTINTLFSRNAIPNSYEDKVLTVEEMERADPAKFLEVKASVHENFWGDKIKIKGTVFNKATVANFKDVVLEITFISKTETIIATERYVIYDFFNAHSNKYFFLKVTNWKGTHTVGCVAVEAMPN
ncbi:MAG: hypothetical protein JWM14_2315 [Chitinophagaceae bacterium]|nr:hypothetical protein [Chitinophagaceae bacterium]